MLFANVKLHFFSYSTSSSEGGRTTTSTSSVSSGTLNNMVISLLAPEVAKNLRPQVARKSTGRAPREKQPARKIAVPLVPQLARTRPPLARKSTAGRRAVPTLPSRIQQKGDEGVMLPPRTPQQAAEAAIESYIRVKDVKKVSVTFLPRFYFQRYVKCKYGQYQNVVQ